MNEYLISAKAFLNRCTPLVSDSLTKSQIIDAIIFFAFGMERIFKGILWDINPSFVLCDPNFKNASVALYSSKLIPGFVPNKEFSCSPNRLDISYRDSLSRVRGFSSQVNKHSNALFALSFHRDIIAHRPLSELNYESARKLLLESFLPIMKDISIELHISLTDLIGETIPGLEVLSNKYKGISEDRIEQKLRLYKQEWERIKIDPSHQGRIESLHREKDRYASFDKLECPACGNLAEITLDVDVDYSDGEAFLCGAYPVELKCNYCGLQLSDWDELEFFEINKRFQESCQDDDLER